MIERYTLPGMAAIWSEENKYRQWLKVEVLACEAQARLGNIPAKDLAVIKEKADFNSERIAELEAVTRHDVLAFLTNVAEYVGDSSKYIHLGMTSSDVVDTAQAVLLVQAAEIIEGRLKKLKDLLVSRAREHKYTLMIGRTHGIHAEPTTFGLKLGLWAVEIQRDLERLSHAKEEIAVGKISGAVGTFANIDPRVEEYVMKELGLKPEPVSTQVVQRDRYAQFMATLAVIGASLEKFATEIRNLQRTDILEVEEGFAEGQKGSSAMPHKKNPITAERVAGLARVLRGNAVAALENVALWHERDITHSSVERVILPDSTTLLDYMLVKFTGIIEKLVIHPENMRRNLERTLGLVFSQRVLLALVEKGELRENAYARVQQSALKAWETGRPFKELILADPVITARLNPAEIEALFDYAYHLKNVDYIFRRAGIEEA